MPSFSPKYRLALLRGKTLTSVPDGMLCLAMVALAFTLGLVLLLAIVKVVLERSDNQARDQDDWI